MLDKFMCDRVYSKKSSLHDRIGRSSRTNFTKVPITKPFGEKLKVKTGEMERSDMAAVINLVQVNGKVQLQDIMENRVTEECLSIFNVNGSFRKVQNKSKMLEKLSMQTITKPTPYTALVDMGLIWHIASTNTEDREKDDGLKYTWTILR
jgi:hypothetical protein